MFGFFDRIPLSPLASNAIDTPLHAARVHVAENRAAMMRQQAFMQVQDQGYQLAKKIEQARAVATVEHSFGKPTFNGFPVEGMNLPPAQPFEKPSTDDLVDAMKAAFCKIIIIPPPAI